MAGPSFGPPVQPMAGPMWQPGRPPYRAYAAYRGGRTAWRVARRVPFPLVLVLGVVGVAAIVSLLMAVIAALFGVAMVVGVIAVPVLIVRGVRRSVRHGQYYRQQFGPPPVQGPIRGPVRGPAIAAPPPRPRVDPWRQAKHRFAALRSEYATYECDALAVLRLPALADVTVPSTARFIEAFAQAQALDVDVPPDQRHRALFVSAVELAWRSWQAAREAAERIRDSHLPPEERSAIERVVRLLTTARDTDNDAERLVAYSKARSELARLERTGHIRIPRPAQAALDNAYRGQLPA